jgi:hypothetical protein
MEPLVVTVAEETVGGRWWGWHGPLTCVTPSLVTAPLVLTFGHSRNNDAVIRCDHIRVWRICSDAAMTRLSALLVCMRHLYIVSSDTIVAVCLLVTANTNQLCRRVCTRKEV